MFLFIVIWICRESNCFIRSKNNFLNLESVVKIVKIVLLRDIGIFVYVFLEFRFKINVLENGIVNVIMVKNLLNIY